MFKDFCLNDFILTAIKILLVICEYNFWSWELEKRAEEGNWTSLCFWRCFFLVVAQRFPKKYSAEKQKLAIFTMVTDKLQRKIQFENETGQRERAHTHTASKHIGSLFHIESNNTGCHADTVWWWFCATCECADSTLLRHFLCSLSFPSFFSLTVTVLTVSGVCKTLYLLIFAPLTLPKAKRRNKKRLGCCCDFFMVVRCFTEWYNDLNGTEKRACNNAGVIRLLKPKTQLMICQNYKRQVFTN